MTLPPAPYDSLVTDKDSAWATTSPTLRTAKISGRVLDSDKSLIMTVLPDRGIYNLLIQHAIKRTADFVRDNGLQYSSEADQCRLLDFITGRTHLIPTKSQDPIRDSTAARALGNPTTRDVPGGTKSIRRPHKNA